MMNYEEFIKSIMVKAEEDAFQKAKDNNQIQNAILIMHPKQKKFVIESGLHMLVLYTPACEEDKAYMVTDEKVCENIKRNLINDTIGGKYE